MQALQGLALAGHPSHAPFLPWSSGLKTEPARPAARVCRAAAESLPAPLSTSAGRCPMSGLVQGLQQQQQVQREELYDDLSYVPTPGPAALSLEAIADVSLILRRGIHEAMLAFSNKYGPVCRCILTCCSHSGCHPGGTLK